jgi:predicted regulator of Ras-like GTPase activity (Roadblock/LC7/MglB family)
VSVVDSGADAEDVRGSLATLRDVAGITGSFLFTRGGRLVARELPPLFDDIALAEASGRLTRLQETFAAAGDQLEVAVLRYRDHKLYVKVLADGMLCIITDGVVNMAALRMAANLVARRVSPALQSASALPLAATAAALKAPPAPARPAPGYAPPGMRRFRGRPVE